MIKRNLIANYIGQGWRALMSLAFIPIYIKCLGMEAYGLIAIFSILLSAMALLDLGMKPALSREMSHYSGGAYNHQLIWNLLRSIEIISSIIVVATAIVIWVLSGWLATTWVNAETLPTSVVEQSFTLMGILASLQFFESIYSSSLGGLQRQVLQNGILCVMSTIRGFGAIGVLFWISPTPKAFFIWQAICSFTCLLACAIALYRSLPAPPDPPRFSKSALLSIWKFASGIFFIIMLALLLTQLDKALLSKILPLESFGYYALAGVVTGLLTALAGPITSTYYLRFNQLIAKNETNAISSAFHKSAQLVTVIVGSTTAILFFFPEQLLILWSNDMDLAGKTAPIMSILALGTCLNCLTWVPYQIQLAYGWTSLTIIMSTVAVVILVPAILILVPIYGPIAAAWIWVTLNAGFFLIGAQFMFQRILKKEKWKWYIDDVTVPLVTTFTVTFIVSHISPTHFSKWLWLTIVIAWVMAIGTAALATPLGRTKILNYLRDAKKIIS